MARVYRPHYSKPFPPGLEILKLGKQKGKPVARVRWPNGKTETVRTNEAGDRMLVYSQTWRIRYYSPDGERHEVKGYKDKKATETKAAELERRAIRIDAGLVDPLDVHSKRPLAEHLADYRAYLADKGNTPAHVELTFSRVQACLDYCRFDRVGEVQPSAVLGFLADLRKPSKDADGFERSGKSVTTCNYYLVAVKSFTRWLVRDKRASPDPLAGMSKLANSGADVRHARRDFSADELQRLLEAAKVSACAFRGLTGADRFALYAAAAGTGFRVRELQSLTPDSFDLAS